MNTYWAPHLYRWALSASQWQLQRCSLRPSKPTALKSYATLNNWSWQYTARSAYPSNWLQRCSIVTWLAPRKNCCRLGASSVYTIQPCTSLHRNSLKLHTYGECVFSCKLSPAFLFFFFFLFENDWDLLRATRIFVPERLGSFTCYCGNTGVQRIPKWKLERIWIWRRKSSRRWCRESNPRPFDHWRVRRSAIELSRPPIYLHIYVNYMRPNSPVSTVSTILYI